MCNLIIAALFAATLAAPVREIEPADGFYAQTAIVTDVDHDLNIVMTATMNGNAWSFYGAEDWLEGDICSLLMYDNSTPEIYDDVIVGARYSGTLDWITADEEGVQLNFTDGTGYYYEYWEEIEE